MWSARQLAMFSVGLSGAYAGSGDSDCGAFTRFVDPGVEVCSDDFCSKLKIECPDGYTSTFDGSIKCKGGLWKGIDPSEIIMCNVDYKLCDYEKLAATSDDVKTKCDGNTCKYSCKDGSEVSVGKATCDTQFGNWQYQGRDSKPGKIRCAGLPKEPKATKPPKESDCAAFENYDGNSVNVLECSDKRCTFECKEGFHSISSDTAKCKHAGFWKLSNGAERVVCYGEGETWMNEWKSDEFEPPFKCDPDDLRRVTLTRCTDVDGDGAITNCDVMCRGVKIDEVRCINHRPKWSNEYFDC